MAPYCYRLIRVCHQHTHPKFPVYCCKVISSFQIAENWVIQQKLRLKLSIILSGLLETAPGWSRKSSGPLANWRIFVPNCNPSIHCHAHALLTMRLGPVGKNAWVQTGSLLIIVVWNIHKSFVWNIVPLRSLAMIWSSRSAIWDAIPRINWSIEYRWILSYVSWMFLDDTYQKIYIILVNSTKCYTIG